MKVLLIGSGGREHALAWKMAQSKRLTKLYIAPGNAGTALVGENISFDGEDLQGIGDFVKDKEIELVVVGPEAPLVAGISDYFVNHPELSSIPVIGPSKLGATLEGSKEFAKEFMVRHNIPTAAYLSVDLNHLEDGYRQLEVLKPPYVLKADGLAAGKGVLIIDDLQEAKSELKAMLEGKFGSASTKVVIEEHLKGIELSVFVLTDGIHYKILPSAKDYKRIGEGDTGLNTGGMGCVSPVPFADAAFLEKVEKQIIKPTVAGLQKDSIAYNGFIFIGLMNDNGTPKVIEYNVRMGDPETEVIMPRLQCDLVEVFEAVGKKELDKVELTISNDTVVTVMLVSAGYPGNYEKNKIITGLDRVVDSWVFHAGTKISGEEVVTNGGRVLSVSSSGKTMQEALDKSYASIENIYFEGMNYRRDIGFDLRS